MDFSLSESFSLFVAMWPIYGLIFSVIFAGLVLVLLVELLRSHLRRARSKRSFAKGVVWRKDQQLLNWLSKMHPADFEEYVAALFRKLGYRSSTVGRTGDHGIDVEIEKDGIVSYVQCKRYSQKHRVGEPDIRNFLGSLAHKHAQSKGYFITTSFFTLDAELFAADKPIELIDGLKLVGYMRSAEGRADEHLKEREK